MDKRPVENIPAEQAAFEKAKAQLLDTMKFSFPGSTAEVEYLTDYAFHLAVYMAAHMVSHDQGPWQHRCLVKGQQRRCDLGEHQGNVHIEMDENGTPWHWTAITEGWTNTNLYDPSLATESGYTEPIGEKP